MFLIYVLSSSKSERVYVGQTRRRLEQRFFEHLRSFEKTFLLHLPVVRWMKKYENNISIELLEVVDKKEKLNDAERKWIKFYRELLGKHLVLNVSDGGNGNFDSGISEATKRGMKKIDMKVIFNRPAARQKKREVANELWSRKSFRDKIVKSMNDPETRAHYMGYPLEACLYIRDAVLSLKSLQLNNKQISNELQINYSIVRSIVGGLHWTFRI